MLLQICRGFVSKTRLGIVNSTFPLVFSLFLGAFTFSVVPIFAQSLIEEEGEPVSIEELERVAQQAYALRQSDADRAIQLAQEVLSALSNQYDNNLQVSIFNTLAIAWLQKRDFSQSADYAQRALELASVAPLPHEVAKAQNTLGVLHWYRGDLDAAKSWFQSSLSVRKQHNFFDEFSPALNNLGLIEEIQGRYNKAIDYYLQAISYAEQINNDIQLARPIGNLGVLHQMLGNFEKAEIYYQRSLQLKLKEKNYVGAALAHNNISEVYVENKDYSKALNSLREGLTLLKGLDAQYERALLTVNMGSVLLQLQQVDNALLIFDQVADLVKDFDSQEIDIYLAQGYARAKLQQGLLDEALAHAQEFLILAQAKEDQNSIKKAQKLRYQIYKEKGQYLQALVSHENYTRIQEDQSARETTEYVSRLQAEFDLEKKEKKLAILERENTLHELEIRRQQFSKYFVILASAIVLLIGVAWFRLRATRIKASILEAKVAERTREIQQQHATISELLEQKEKLLNHKNALFSTVSHEFRTPLTLILGPLKTLAEKIKSKDLQDSINNMRCNANRLLRMVDQMLDLARMDMQADMKSEFVEVSEVVGFLVASMETLFNEHQLHYTKELQADIWINISPDALEKIVVNLLSNAIKYTPASGCITVQTVAKNEQVVISVVDSGIGIPRDQMDCIFERFTRLDHNAGKAIPGAGVGLALVKELVQRYNGSIEVTSCLGEGSSFSVCFPQVQAMPSVDLIQIDNKQSARQLRSTACESELASLQVVKSLRKVYPIDCSAKTILVVEDNEEMRHFIGECLQLNYQCLFANNGVQGVNIAIKEIPDLIVTDLMMPEMSGLELACILREEPLTSHIPIVMLTAKGDPESRHAAWQQKVDEYIQKPFDADELRLRCENILNIRQLLNDRFKQRKFEKGGDDLSVENNNVNFSEYSQNCFSECDRKFLSTLTNYLENNFSEPQLNASKISSALAITEKQFQRKLKALTNDSIPAYVRNFRLKKSAELLAKGVSITSVAFDVGFSSQSYFSTAFAARYGCSPSEYQQRQRKQYEEKAGAKAG